MNTRRFRLTYLVVITLILFLLESCLYTQKTPSDFSKLLNDSTRYADGARLHYNGAYTRAITVSDSVYMESPLFFFENGRVMLHYAVQVDSTSFANWITKYANEKWSLNKWGVYELKEDTIKAIIYIDYFGKPFRHRRRLLPTYFEGISEKKETIRHWRMVPPYPQIAQNYDMNEDSFEFLTTPHDLIFRQSGISKLIDPKQAWISKEQ